MLKHSIVLLSLLSVGLSATFSEFFLFTRSNLNEAQKVTSASLKGSSYDSSKPTKIVIHGYGDSLKKGKWLASLKDLFLEKEDSNVLLVDVSRANVPVYQFAAALAPRVAREVADLIKASGSNPSNVHVIGHSLGAQISGFVGKEFGGQIGHITGLDPAGPSFQGHSTSKKLWSTDAQFVDIYHTDMGHIFSLGTNEVCGHTDFFINGGSSQPGCLMKRLTGERRERIACDHVRAVDYYLASYNPSEPIPRAYECSSWAKFKLGECHSCGENQEKCAMMGPKAVEWGKNNTGNIRLYISTAGETPYIRYQYAVVAKTSEASLGKLQVQIDDKTVELSNTFSSSGESYSTLFLSDKKISSESIQLILPDVKRGDSNFSIEYVKVVSMSDERPEEYKFCSTAELQGNQPNNFNLC